METEAERPQDPQSDSQQDSKKPNSSSLAFRIWPPTQRTRDAVIARLVETLTTPSVLSKRYGSMPADEADSTARSIENEAFSVADLEAGAAAEVDGIEVLQVYSKEISKRILESVKSRASAVGTGSTTGLEDSKNGAEAAGEASEDAVSSAEMQT
ncbi:MFP1 attachment factor 1-like [Mangifera indica]|uniref:MFP1 attachment factor 1-like n=1 Tax=Mangifera indica TaxID=29780 RepID=UPI001CFB28EE|nr:MFP1 attachment factor 1-like [Mangifera indica]XP_044474478.1 MFP1 attachment factor 1-like [Mangifera indica]